jgi:Xaa-Pro aminopeptidase
MKSRINALQKSLVGADLDGYLVSHLPHIQYLCGFSGSNALLLVTPRRADFFTDNRYTEQIRTEVKGTRKNVPTDGDLVAMMAALPMFSKGHPRIGFQPRHTTIDRHAMLSGKLNGALLVPHDHLVDALTLIKDKKETDSIRKAAEIVDRAFEFILPEMKAGVRERVVAAKLEYQMLMLGSEGAAFETICASGHRSALPHGKASSKKIRSGDFVTLDYGALVDGYASDITRTVVIGKASARQKKIYDIVKRAQQAAVRKIRPGASTRAVDAAARDIISKAGYGKQFGHSTGHGLGLEVHQGPSLSPRNDSRLAAGMIVTVEPGIYIPGFGGVRIEDDVRVTRSGYEVLTQAPKKLIEL